MFETASFKDAVRVSEPMSKHTTMRVGGPADFFVEIKNIKELEELIDICAKNMQKIYILGEGSNVIISDQGIRGVVVRLLMNNQVINEEGKDVVAKVEAGVLWDEFVKDMVERGYAGIEAMSGVPGTVGAAPVQNIGCYGQELSDTFVSLTAYDTRDNRLVVFDKNKCNFGYRTSFFKADRSRRYIIVSVAFKLAKQFHKVPRYPDIETYLLNKKITKPTVKDIRKAVLSIRKSKSMVLDDMDPNTTSVGSFFTNPVINENHLKNIKKDYPNIPYYSLPDGQIKLPVAWLVEACGFRKGHTEGDVGISTNHSLAIINKGQATTVEILDFAEKIKKTIFSVFKININIEPEIIV